MFSKLLLVLGVAFGCGSNLIVKSPHNVYDLSFSYDSTNNENFYYYGALFSDWSVTWVDDNSVMVVCAEIQPADLLDMPDKVFDYFYLGDFGDEYDFSSVRFDFPGVQAFELEPPLNSSFPFIKSDNKVLYDKTLFPEILFIYEIWVNFGYSIQDANARVYAEFGFIYEIAFTNELGVGNYYADLQNVAYDDGYNDGYNNGASDGYNDGYSDGFSDAEYVGDGTWLGNLVFGTIGGIVGFLFALSDFEVLGVSIMSIITLFVAIGIVRLLLKVLK